MQQPESASNFQRLLQPEGVEMSLVLSIKTKRPDTQEHPGAKMNYSNCETN